MKCSDFRSSVSELVDGLLTDDKANEMVRHTVSCPDCAKEYNQLNSLTTSLRSLGDKTVPQDCWAAVSLRISKSKRPAFNLFSWKYVAAPAALVLFLAAYMLMSPQSQTVADKPAPAAYRDYINIHAGAGASQPWSESDFYIISAGTQSTGDR